MKRAYGTLLVILFVLAANKVWSGERQILKHQDLMAQRDSRLFLSYMHLAPDSLNAWEESYSIGRQSILGFPLSLEINSIGSNVNPLFFRDQPFLLFQSLSLRIGHNRLSLSAEPIVRPTKAGVRFKFMLRW